MTAVIISRVLSVDRRIAGATHEWQTLCIWGGPCSAAAGGGDSWQVMVQMLRVAGAEHHLGPYDGGRTSIFGRTLNFVIALAHNCDYRFHPIYSMAVRHPRHWPMIP